MEKGSAFNLYSDIAERTDGDVYMGVVGPVRTGKSTFIARFMEQLVLPMLPEGPRRDRLSDELPQSGSGRSIMTTQPKFVPGEAVEVMLQENTPVRIRLVDSVGFLVKGALGVDEGDHARMVHTPWFEEDVPFEQAAETGTRRVMTDHATIGLIVTTDGSIAELPRSAYVDAEERVIAEMKQLGKPFVLLLNSAHPRQADTLALRDAMEEKYAVPVMLLNVKEMQVEDIQHVLESLLMEFPLREVRLSAPAWLDALDESHWLVSHVLSGLTAAGARPRRMREAEAFLEAFAQSEHVSELHLERQLPGEGRIELAMAFREGLFNRVLSEECGTEIRGDAHLLALMKELVSAKTDYDHIAEALRAARETGYGLVTPQVADMTLERPELLRQGAQYGVKLRAQAPSLHLIRVDVDAEVTPVVGNEQQSEAFVRDLIRQYDQQPDSLWQTNFFGRSLHDMVRDGITGKLQGMPQDARIKLQETLSRMVNEGEGGMICILL